MKNAPGKKTGAERTYKIIEEGTNIESIKEIELMIMALIDQAIDINNENRKISANETETAV
jgi:hypothetical protein